MSLVTYIDMLYGAEPEGAFAEMRWKLSRDTRMGQEFVEVRDPRLPDLLRARGAQTDTYIGVAPRARQDGTRAGVERCHALFVDCDTPQAIAALEIFEPTPSMVIGSGSGRHAYWALLPTVGPDELERANRRLAYALGADMRATDAARILRPPETFNFKGGRPVPVVTDMVNVEIYAIDEVVGHLPDPPRPERPRAVPTGSRTVPASDDPLMSIPPAVYVEALTGQEVGRDGKVACPFHDDRTPSLHAYPTPERGWCCHARPQ